MGNATADDAPKSRLGYGTPKHLAQMLDSIRITLDDEPQDQWDDPSLRVSTEKLRDHLSTRLRAGRP